MSSRPHIAVVGGGFSGAMLAVQLMRRAWRPLAITIIERKSVVGHGTAYGVSGPELILNVPAARMSAFQDDPDHFVRWLQLSGSNVPADQFAPRSLYGSYVNDVFRRDCQTCQHATVSCISDHAVSLELNKDKLSIVLQKRGTLDADLAVLAIGNSSPKLLPCLRGLNPRMLAEFAWDEDALAGIPPDGAVLILGTGLTAIDQILSLRAQGFQGAIFALSRRGQFPAVHGKQRQEWPTGWAAELPGNLRRSMIAVREQIQLAENMGTDWRAVIDSLRPHTKDLWRRFSIQDRGQFLRHVQSYWANARHRVPLQTFSRIESLLDNGQLRVLAGTILSSNQLAGRACVRFRKRGCSENKTLIVDRIVNCMGAGVPTRASSPLLNTLIEQRLVKRDRLGIGIETTVDGCVVSGDGRISNRLFAIGPVCRASLWETTAVAEIRMQAADLAAKLLGTLGIQ